MPNVHFRAVTNLRGEGKVQINGHDLSAICAGFAVATDAEAGHRITLELAAPDVNLNLESAEVELDSSTQDALEELGWTHAKLIAEVRATAEEADRQAQAAREAARECRAEMDARADRLAALEVENASLRRARTEDAAELARLREEVEQLTAEKQEPAPAGEEAP